MKVLMISKSGDGLGLAHYMKIHGNEVFLWIKEDKDFEYAGLGMFTKVRNWRTVLGEVDLVLSDMVGFGGLEGVIKESGKPYIGFNKNADDLELDRAGQMEIMRRLGILLPKTIAFDSPRAAEAMLEMWAPNSPGYVIKPSGNLATGKTLVCRDHWTYQWALSTYGGSQELVVQEIVEGVEISTEGWFDGREFVPGLWNHTFEEKRLYEGDLGPNTGCMGNVVFLAKEDSQLVAQVKKFEDVLRNFKYVGPFDLNTIVNESGIYALEVTPRFGYDAVEVLATMATGDFTDQLLEFANKALIEPRFRSSIGIAVRLHLPPYPFNEAESSDRGRPIILAEDENLVTNRGLCLLTDAYIDANVQIDGYFLWAASDGVVGKVTQVGDNLDEAITEVYKRVSSVRCLDIGYRRDIGRRVMDASQKLEELGVL